MPAIFTQVYRDPIGATKECEHRSGYGVRNQGATGLPKGGHMINIHAQPDHARNLI
jgi:hypothetical protein